MKKAKDRWINGHLAVGLLFLSCLVLPSVSAVKATSLFRTTTTSTTRAPTEQEETSDGVDAIESDGAAPPTPPPTNYTGIPQIDYIHDPNLPRELRGYNLSSYPFYETVPPPEEMDFKCDGLHDGFYASVPHKCQVYHHCLYGTRYDFLCANYTAFDQKTFICHFVSEVDCVNSPKYFHRNDALYTVTTTSTAAPLTTTTTTTTTAAPPVRSRGGGGRRRPPNRRPRPQYDYYDDEYYPSARDEDYYEEERRSYGDSRGNRRRKRPRPRRPIYDDDDYEDDRYNRRPIRNRDEGDGDYDERTYERPRKPSRRPSEDRERPDTRKQYDDEEDSRSYERPRKTFRPSDDRRNHDRPRRPYRGDENRYDAREDENKKDDKNMRNERPFREERPVKDRPLRDERPRNDDRRNRDENNRNEERSYGENKKYNEDVEPTAGGTLVKPNGGSIYSKPRVPPKIARPVPNSEKEKYKYVTISSTQTPKPAEDEEYYDEYEIVEDSKSTPQTITSTTHKSRENDRDRYKSKERNRSNFDKDAPKRPLSDASNKYKPRRPEVEENKKVEYTDEYVYEDEIEEAQRSKKPASNRERGGTKYTARKRPSKTEDEYIYDDEKPTTTPSLRISERPKVMRTKYNENDKRNNKNGEEKPNESSTESQKSDKSGKNAYVRIIKRPFLPSRGGSPYLPRGLQPLGGKNFNQTTTTTTTTTTSTTTTTTPEQPSQLDYSYETEYEIVDDKNENDESPIENYSEEIYPDKEQPYKENKPKDTEYTSIKPDAENTQQSKNKPQDSLYHTDKSDTNNRAKPQYESTEYRDNYKNSPTIPQKNIVNEKIKESEPIFRPSPQFTHPIKVTSKPYTPKIPENISIKQNLADSIENDYDVTINDALNPTLPNLAPIRNFPSPFSPTSERDYAFSRFRTNNNNYQEPNSAQQYNYQYRNQQINSNPYKYSVSPSRGGSTYGKNSQIDSAVAASDPIIVGVSLRTPQSFYLQQPRHTATFSLDEADSEIRPSHLIHRHIKKGDYYI